MGTAARWPIPLPSRFGLVLALPRIRRPAGCRRAGPEPEAGNAANDGYEPNEAPMERPSALLHDEDTGTKPPPRGRVHRPVVERIAGWSAKHRKTALLGWLLLVAGAVVIGNMLGTKNLNSYDPGQSGQAERVLARPGVVQPATETVLVQAPGTGHTVAGDPEIR